MTKVIKNPKIKGTSRGATSIELALVFVLFFFLLGGMIDLIYYAYQEVRLQYLAVTAARNGIIQRTLDGVATPNSYLKSAIISTSAAWGITIDASNISICPVTNPNCGDFPIPDEAYFIIRISLPNTTLFYPFTVPMNAVVLGINSTPVKITNGM